MATTLTIRELGSQGDGYAEHEGRKVFVPLALPGETVTAEIDGDRGRLVDIVTPSPDRVGQRCRHYGECGGCALQHLADPAYLEFKRGLVVSALASRGLDAEVDPVIALAPRTRRRAVFAAFRSGKTVAVGFHGRRSHRIVPIRDCAVITPGLQALLPKLERLAQIAAPPKDALTITAADTPGGFDVALTGVHKGFSADDRVRLVQAAGDLVLARLSINGEIAMEREPPAIRAGAAHLVPPPGGFLQACEPSEAAMVRLVQEAVGDARKVVDMFSGAGTFSLPLASTATVHAVESDEAALAALGNAARKAHSQRGAGLKPVTTEKRDLFRRPLTAAELKRFDAAVIDPPRAGAEAQSQQLAASSIGRVAMVSCSAGTFARDLRLMVDGGYRIDRITPVDQFLWSPHIEIVAALER
jgi:23S rRNA (uracil1939-C5)-methyltransferase